MCVDVEMRVVLRICVCRCAHNNHRNKKERKKNRGKKASANKLLTNVGCICRQAHSCTKLKYLHALVHLAILGDNEATNTET